ncbi:SURF1 family protein [Oxalobacteraceae bacterium OM1]|nr:SURF1 family protein [Oxalobacteraceae bacterium OM1]
MFLACAVFAFAVLAALGTWQVFRLQWKEALIARVEERVHAAPVPAPGPERWPDVTAASDEYRHVRLTGSFLADRSTRVQAVTELGSGYWVLTPLRTADGNVVLVNRGYVPADALRDAGAAPAGTVTLTGLLRITEPGGGFLRKNDPAHDRWYSRDVQAIAAARGLEHVAPYFVDADANQESGPGAPVGGLTVIKFHNSHLVYALTWYALALMVAGATWKLLLRPRRRS